jgi:hypothetical protein
MSTTPTDNYGWLVPDVGTEEDTYGPIVNQIFEDIDADLKAVFDAIAGAGAVVDAPNLGAASADGDFTIPYDISASRFAEVTCDRAGSPGLTVTATGGAALGSNEKAMEGTLIVLFSGSQVGTLGAQVTFNLDSSFDVMYWNANGVAGVGPVTPAPVIKSGYLVVHYRAIRRSTGTKVLYLTFEAFKLS